MVSSINVLRLTTAAEEARRQAEDFGGGYTVGGFAGQTIWTLVLCVLACGVIMWWKERK